MNALTEETKNADLLVVGEHGHSELPGMHLGSVHLHGGPALVRRFLPQLIELICSRTIDPGKVFDLTLPLAPGARTAWHAHSIAQTLRVTDGEGLVQARGEQAIKIRPVPTPNTRATDQRFKDSRRRRWRWPITTPAATPVVPAARRQPGP